MEEEEVRNSNVLNISTTDEGVILKPDEEYGFKPKQEDKKHH